MDKIMLALMVAGSGWAMPVLAQDTPPPPADFDLSDLGGEQTSPAAPPQGPAAPPSDRPAEARLSFDEAAASQRAADPVLPDEFESRQSRLRAIAEAECQGRSDLIVTTSCADLARTKEREAEQAARAAREARAADQAAYGTRTELGRRSDCRETATGTGCSSGITVTTGSSAESRERARDLFDNLLGD